MVKNDKKNKREYERKVRSEGGHQQEQQPERSQKGAKPVSGGSGAAPTVAPPSNFTGMVITRSTAMWKIHRFVDTSVGLACGLWRLTNRQLASIAPPSNITGM